MGYVSIADRRTLVSIWSHDRNWSPTIADDCRRSQKIQHGSIFCDRLRSSAITIAGSQKCVSIWSQTIAELFAICDPRPAIRDRLRSYGNQPFSFIFPFGDSSNSTDGFTEWGSWSQCSRTCGSNLLRVRKRSCFKQNNQGCSGSTSEVKPCILPRCPEDFIASFRTEAGLAEMTSSNSEFIYFTFKNFRLNLEIQLTIKISEKTEQRRFGVILAPFSS